MTKLSTVTRLFVQKLL